MEPMSTMNRASSDRASSGGMEASLYDILKGRFEGDDRRLQNIPASQRRVMSIVDNLSRLFNARQGALEHLEGYGLPEIAEIYRDAPDSIPHLQRAIRQAVRTYEPRLTDVQVVHRPSEDDRAEVSLTFLLSARLAGRDAIRLETVFQSGVTHDARRSVSPASCVATVRRV